MRKFAYLVFTLCALNAPAQQVYPIRTIFKGDSVVILTTRQSNLINSKIAALEEKANCVQPLTEQNTALKAQNQQLVADLERSRALADSLRSLHVSKLDTFINDPSNGWMLNAAIGDRFLHIDWSDPTIKWIDLNIHRQGENDHFGYFRLMRNEKNVSVYTLGSPNDYSYNKKKTGPVIYQYPFRFTFDSKKTESK